MNNTQTDNAKYIDVVMTMYNLVEYRNSYSNTSGRLWQYQKSDPNDNKTRSELFKFKIKITGKTTVAGNTKDVEIAVSLKYLSNFWRTFKIPLINFEINLSLTDRKLYVPVVNLSTQDNEKMLKPLKSGFKRTINWNKYQPNVSPERRNLNSDFLIDPSFQEIIRNYNRSRRSLNYWLYIRL